MRPQGEDSLRVAIQEAKEQDQKEIFRLIARQRQADAIRAGLTYHRHFHLKQRPRDRVFVARRGREIIGVSGYWYDDYAESGVYWLGWTYVDRNYQGQGIGQKLLDRVIQELKKKKARKLYVDTSSRNLYRQAIRFYLANGFKREGRFKDYYQNGEDQIVMGKELGR
jgi:ribosomal protein S18 acetylase RimI-like enzyme